MDDDRDFAESIGDVFELRGHDVTIVFDNESALDKFRAEVFDVALMDVRLPGKSGIDGVLDFRAENDTAAIFLMTGFSISQILDETFLDGSWEIFEFVPDPKIAMARLEAVGNDGALIVPAEPEPLQRFLRQAVDDGYRVVTISDEAGANEAASDPGVDLLVFDLKLPLTAVLGFVRRIRVRGVNVPVLFGNPFIDNDKTGPLIQDLEKTGILTKPFDPAGLLQIVEKLFSEGTEEKRADS